MRVWPSHPERNSKDDFQSQNDATMADTFSDYLSYVNFLADGNVL